MKFQSLYNCPFPCSWPRSNGEWDKLAFDVISGIAIFCFWEHAIIVCQNRCRMQGRRVVGGGSHASVLMKPGFVQSLKFLKKSGNLRTTFPDLEKVWKLKAKSWKMGWSLEFFSRSSICLKASWNLCNLADFTWINLGKWQNTL